MAPTERPSVRLDSLTGLRAAAAAIVFSHHAVAYSAVAQTPIATWLTRSMIDGVSFFFILSGFVLTWSSRPGDNPLAFWRRRAARILPLYWLAWIVGLVIVESLAGPQSLRRSAPSALLLQSWFPDPSVYFAANSPGWSLSCEAFFYALFPVLIVALRKSPIRLLWAVLAVAVGAAIAIPLALHALLPGALDSWASYVFPPTRALEFIAGIAAALLLRAGAWPRIPLAPTVCLAVVMVLIADSLPAALQPVASTVVPFTLLLVAAAQRDCAGRATVFARRWFVKAGEWSFAFYLIHLSVIQVVVAINRRMLHIPSPAAGIASLVLSVAAAAFLCEWVEKPLERRFRVSRPLPAVLAA